MIEKPDTAHNSRYTLRSSLSSVVAVLGLRHIFSATAFATLGLFVAEKTSHSGKRCRTFWCLMFQNNDKLAGNS